MATRLQAAQGGLITTYMKDLDRDFPALTKSVENLNAHHNEAIFQRQRTAIKLDVVLNSVELRGQELSGVEASLKGIAGASEKAASTKIQEFKERYDALAKRTSEVKQSMTDDDIPLALPKFLPPSQLLVEKNVRAIPKAPSTSHSTPVSTKKPASTEEAEAEHTNALLEALDLELQTLAKDVDNLVRNYNGIVHQDGRVAVQLNKTVTLADSVGKTLKKSIPLANTSRDAVIQGKVGLLMARYSALGVMTTAVERSMEAHQIPTGVPTVLPPAEEFIDETEQKAPSGSASGSNSADTAAVRVRKTLGHLQAHLFGKPTEPKKDEKEKTPTPTPSQAPAKEETEKREQPVPQPKAYTQEEIAKRDADIVKALAGIQRSKL